jgi:quercetin dioxygenase-like cupin family protein
MVNEIKMPRMVVTGIDKNNRSRVEKDDALSYQDYPEFQGIRVSDIWKAASLPAALEIPVNENTHTVGPNINEDLKGFNVRHIVFPPHSEYALHTTSTIDFAVVMSGQIVAILENDEVTLKQNDIFIQRATHHGWKNVTDTPCAVLLFIVGADANRSPAA